MNIAAQQDLPQSQPAPIALKGTDKVKKEQPKILEKVIDKVESFLTKTVEPESQSKQPQQKEAKPPKQQSQPKQQTSAIPEQAEVQGSLGSSSEYVLPEGTTIKLPDGKEFVTHVKSKISKMEGGE